MYANIDLFFSFWIREYKVTNMELVQSIYPNLVYLIP